MDISNIIAKGFREHSFFDSLSPVDEVTETFVSWDRAQLALSILAQFLGEEEANQKTADYYREFLNRCGFSADFAREVVRNEEDPLTVY